MADEARYILAKKIARGGMAEIYLGKQVGEDGFQRLCAIKRILPHYSADNEFIQMFRDEAHICKRLQHANIVRVEGFEEVEGSYAIIMEFVDGADLRTLLHAVEQAKKKMMNPMACFIIAEAARGLHYAHTKVDEITQQPLGIVHRDISPQNILVSFEGEVKVTDFGIADAESKLTETRPGIVKGKYSYMSPEQISAKPVDARTDVFALSIVLWEMLSMRRLFQGDNEVDTIQRVKNCRIDLELRQLNPDVDEELDTIVKRGLAKDPKKRYRTAADFEKDLRRYMSRKHPDFTPEDLGNFLKKNMETRRTESAADIKKTLTETNLRPNKKSGSGSSAAPTTDGSKRRPDLELDAAKGGPAISLARPVGLSSTRPLTMSGVSQTPKTSASSFNRYGHTRGTGHGHNAAVRRASGVNKMMLFSAIAVIALAIGMKVIINLAAQPKNGVLMLRTQPSLVKLLLDNKPLNEGHYMHASSRTPLQLKSIKPGNHSLIVMRPGYTPARYDFAMEDGEHKTKDDIVLKEKSPLAAVRVRLKPGDKSVKIDINEGYFVAKLSPNGKGVAPDVLQNHKYNMKVFPDEGKEFDCSFTPKSVSWRAPNEIIVDRKERKCTLSTP